MLGRIKNELDKILTLRLVAQEHTHGLPVFISTYGYLSLLLFLPLFNVTAILGKSLQSAPSTRKNGKNVKILRQ